jgi:hypothetical protein
MSDFLRFMAEPLVITGCCAIMGGILMIVLSKAFASEWEKPPADPAHVRPRATDAKPWHLDTSGNPLVKRPRHRLEDTQSMTQNLGGYLQRLRPRVAMIGGTDAGQETQVDHTVTPSRLRVDEGEGHDQEEGREDRERGEDEGRAVAHGEEGGTYQKAASPVTSWRYLPATDRYVHLDEYGKVDRTIDAQSWEERRGEVAYLLFREGVEMIPEHVPYLIRGEVKAR